MSKVKYTYKLGDKINKLTITSERRNKHNQIQLICLCDCGTEVYVLPRNLFTNNTKSCGCHKRQIASTKRKYSVGDRIGTLTLMEELEPINGKRQFKIKCDCGIIKNKTLHYGVESCGCSKWKHVDADRSEYKNYVFGCKRRGMLFSLTKEEFSKLIHQNCYYCNKLPQIKMHVGKILRNGIDRIDSNKGYIIDNCITCCANCNFAKRQLSMDDFLTMVKNIYHNLIQK